MPKKAECITKIPTNFHAPAMEQDKSRAAEILKSIQKMQEANIPYEIKRRISWL